MGETVKTVADLRPSVAAFALAMERGLRANAHKGSRVNWRKDAPTQLLARVCDEFVELAHETYAGNAAERNLSLARHHVDIAAMLLRQIGTCGGQGATNAARMLAEGADVANMTLMFVDACGALPVPAGLE